MLGLLKGDKFDPKYNTSTNGLAISSINLPCPLSSSSLTKKSSKIASIFSKKEKKTEEYIQFNIMDFGGQDIFHSTHRIFFTCNAVYIVMFKLSDPQSFGRVEYPFLFFAVFCCFFLLLFVI